MNIVEVRAELENELTWRQNEIRFLRNQLAQIQKEDQRRIYRKSLVVMLYSHFEGFCKEGFCIYVAALNGEFLTRKVVNDCICAASAAAVFQAYGDTNRKSPIFRTNLPDDTKLHTFARQVELLSVFENFFEDIVEIPESVVDTESNLKPVVLRKLLYRLGFPYDCFQSSEGKIHFLLKKRNNIAHGSEKGGLDEKEYADVETETFTVMESLKDLIVEHLEKGYYLKTATP